MLVWIYRFKIGRPYLLSRQHLTGRSSSGVVQIVHWYVLIAVVSECI